MLSHRIDVADSTVTSMASTIFAVHQVAQDPELWSFVSDILPTTQSGHPPSVMKQILGLVKFLDAKPRREEEDDQPARFFFPLFTSFLTGASGDSPVFQSKKAHHDLAATCLEIMASELRFNVCQFPSSFLQNKDVPGLKDMAKTGLSTRLRYVCQYWTHHVAQIDGAEDTLLHLMSGFFRSNFFPWLEVISIAGFSPADALKGLSSIQVCNSFIIIKADRSKFLL